MLLSLGSHDQSKESAWDSHFIEPITRPCSRYSFFSPNKTVSRKKTQKGCCSPTGGQGRTQAARVPTARSDEKDM